MPKTGHLLIEAKAELPHGEFEAMVAGRLPFKPSTAQRLMIIARDERLANPAHRPLLPPSWRMLYELADAKHTSLLPTSWWNVRMRTLCRRRDRSCACAAFADFLKNDRRSNLEPKETNPPQSPSIHHPIG